MFLEILLRLNGNESSLCSKWMQFLLLKSWAQPVMKAAGILLFHAFIKPNRNPVMYPLITLRYILRRQFHHCAIPWCRSYHLTTYLAYILKLFGTSVNNVSVSLTHITPWTLNVASDLNSCLLRNWHYINLISATNGISLVQSVRVCYLFWGFVSWSRPNTNWWPLPSAFDQRTVIISVSAVTDIV